MEPNYPETETGRYLDGDESTEQTDTFLTPETGGQFDIVLEIIRVHTDKKI